MATVADVAKKAGVSVSTAARVISGHGYAAEKTRRHVLEAAKDLGYVPNQIARSLRTRRTQMIGLLIGDLENLFYSSIARNVESVTKDAGYHLVLCNSDDDPEVEREYLTLLEGIHVDALIVTPTSKNRQEPGAAPREGDGHRPDGPAGRRSGGRCDPRGQRGRCCECRVAPHRGRAFADRHRHRRTRGSHGPAAARRIRARPQGARHPAPQGARQDGLVPSAIMPSRRPRT